MKEPNTRVHPVLQALAEWLKLIDQRVRALGVQPEPLAIAILEGLKDRDMHSYELSKYLRQNHPEVLEMANTKLFPMLTSLVNRGVITTYTLKEEGKLRRYYHLGRADKTA